MSKYYRIINLLLILINVHYKCCGDDFLDFNNEWDEEYRRLMSNELLHGYINENYSQDNLLVAGDMNDSISENNNNVFEADNLMTKCASRYEEEQKYYTIDKK